MFTFCFFTQNWCQVTLLPSLYITLLQFHFLSKTHWHCFSIWSRSPTALYCLNTRHPIVMEMNFPYIMCSSFLVLAVNTVAVTQVVCHSGSHIFPTVAWVHSHIVCRLVSLRITQLVILYAKLCFLGIYCLKMTQHSNSTLISTAKCSVGRSVHQSGYLPVCQSSYLSINH